MAQVIVTLFMVIFAAMGIVGVSFWFDTQTKQLETESLAQIEKFMNENVPAAGDEVVDVIEEVKPKDKGNHFGQYKKD